MTVDPDAGVLFLSAADVERAMPDVEQRLDLASRAMRALVSDAELPPKIGVHPRPDELFAHAMPAFVRGPAADGSGDLLGLKWVSGFPANASRGLPAILATILLNDPTTGQLRAVLDGGVITAHRTAAVTGVALRWWLGGRADAVGDMRVAIIGAGVQARSHLLVVEHLLPGADLVISDRSPARAEGLAAEARALGTFASATAVIDPGAAVRDARMVLTMVSFGPERQAIPAEALAAARFVVAVDYDMCVPALLAQAAAAQARFLVDERAQFLATRATGIFAGYPDPTSTLGEAILAGPAAPAGAALTGAHLAGADLALVTHLGVGVADLVFADAVVRAAERDGLGARVGTSEAGERT